tara:strand:+ start:3384 stop:3950 length:567 start_codon:yes stop_codon:yes gene_type:complete
MIQGHIFLVLLLMIIGATVLWTFISSSGSKWSIKAVMTLLVILAILSSWVGLKTMYGYPYDSYPNHGKYFLIGQHVKEPNIKTGDPGAIYVWLIIREANEENLTWVDKLSDLFNGRQPRVYAIQYNRQMHEELQKIDEERRGQPFPITIASEEAKERGEAHQGNDREERQKFVPYVLPDTVLIEKNVN